MNGYCPINASAEATLQKLAEKEVVGSCFIDPGEPISMTDIQTLEQANLINASFYITGSGFAWDFTLTEEGKRYLNG